MVLFNVPGWSISDDPVTVIPKKRKPSSKNDLNKVQSATANIEMLMEQLAASPAMGNTRQEVKGKSGVVSPVQYDQPPKKKRRRAKSNKAQHSQTPVALQGDAAQGALGKKKKKKERSKERTADEAPASLSPSLSQPPPPHPRGTLTSLQYSMKQSLDGARFRYAIHSPPFLSENAQARVSKTPQVDQREALQVR
jgi:ribosomal RNA-processing protein 8